MAEETKGPKGPACEGDCPVADTKLEQLEKFVKAEADARKALEAKLDQVLKLVVEKATKVEVGNPKVKKADSEESEELDEPFEEVSKPVGEFAESPLQKSKKKIEKLEKKLSGLVKAENVVEPKEEKVNLMTLYNAYFNSPDGKNVVMFLNLMAPGFSEVNTEFVDSVTALKGLLEGVDLSAFPDQLQKAFWRQAQAYERYEKFLKTRKVLQASLPSPSPLNGEVVAPLNLPAASLPTSVPSCNCGLDRGPWTCASYHVPRNVVVEGTFKIKVPYRLR